MDTVCFYCYEPLKTALKEAGLSIEDIKKQGKKTLITVSGHKQPAKKADAPGAKQRGNNDCNDLQEICAE
jgi:hypothetical protein